MATEPKSTSKAARAAGSAAEVRERAVQYRREATSDVVTGTVMRVQAAGQATPGPRVAGYLKRAGTERPLAKENLDQLIALVRADAGFDDSVVKRCKPGTSVGFLLVRKPAAQPEETVELVLDFGCDRMLLTRAGTKTAGHATDFGPSRADFVALVKRALPDDAQIKSLR